METYKRLLNYAKPHWKRFLIALSSMLAYSLANSLVSAAIFIVINGLYHRDKVVINMNMLQKLPYIAKYIPQISEISFPIFIVPIMLIAVFLFRGIFDFLSNYQMSNIGIRVVLQVRAELYRHFTYLSQNFYSKGRTGDLMSRILNDVGQIQGAVTDIVMDLVRQPLVILFNIPWVFIWGGKYALYAMLIFPLVAIPIVLLGKKVKKLTRKGNELSADLLSFLQEKLSGMTIIRAFCAEEREIKKFEHFNKKIMDLFKRGLRVTIVQRPLVEVIGAVGSALAIWFGIKYLPADRFVAFIGSLFLFYEPIKKITRVNSTIQTSIAAGERIFEALDSKPSVKEKTNAIDYRENIEEIAYDNVEFSYSPELPLLKDISFKAKHNEVIAFVGSSGSGKSTLVNLALRTYDPTAGAIKINGEDVRNFTLHSLRNLIGVVSQDTILFNTSIRENIAYARPSANIKEVKRAAKLAYADHFIERLPQGYETNLGERGLKLSGGERQRIAIARALLKNPPILILDEATSSLDTQSEREVQKALENLMESRTVLVIAHRLSTIQRANTILVMDKGKIVQRGTHDELLTQGGVYKHLYDLQFDL